MENIKEQHCRLCLNVISDDQFEEIEEATRNIFDFLLLNLDFVDSNKHIICIDCSLQVKEAYEFKSMCLYTDNTIIPHVDYETGCSVDLREIYVKETENKQLMNTLNDDHKVCRLCMQLTSSEFMSVHKLEVDMIEKYIPEINFSVIKDPIICKRCFVSFSTHSGFIQKCLKIKENVKSVHGTKVTASKGWTSSLVSPVKVEDIKIKSELCEQENEFIKIGSTALKSEDEEMLIKTESIDVKAEANDKESYIFPDISPQELEDKDIPKLGKGQFASEQLPTMYICDKCNFQSKHKKSFIGHQIVHKDPLSVQLYKCNLCDFQSKYNSSFKRHMLNHANGPTLPKAPMLKFDILKCDSCDYNTKCKKNLKRHQMKHVNPSEVQLHTCDLCDFKSKYKDSIRLHQLKHADSSEVQMYTCELCDFKSKYKVSLKHHQSKHANPSIMDMYPCDLCDFNAKSKNKLKLHKAKHAELSQARMYECNECNLKFKYEESFWRHQLKHTNHPQSPTYKCDSCVFTTKSKSGFRSHKLHHADPSQIQTYKCDLCDFQTKYKTNLKIHLTGVHKCDLCDFIEKRKFDLKSHKLKHTNHSETGIHKCDLCDFVAKRKFNLKYHKLKHADPSAAPGSPLS
ncbi:GDNF-inducible zinc finger protein 1-like [Anoplophora glabripennis]|uniref:GDNF-inducible zinc finger protein 1-like n=1 Tax=Anoplophora glabripennis TaxID=217634 RepID=UPI0008755551|nr:GDNF-inducible zinc finger protein 1-like [Anoplophora glabripennis]